MARAGVQDVAESTLVATANYQDFDDYWVPFTLAVGPAGEHLRSLDDDQRTAVREACRAALPQGGPFTLDARAWCAVGTV